MAEGEGVRRGEDVFDHPDGERERVVGAHPSAGARGQEGEKRGVAGVEGARIVLWDWRGRTRRKKKKGVVTERGSTLDITGMPCTRRTPPRRRQIF